MKLSSDLLATLRMFFRGIFITFIIIILLIVGLTITYLYMDIELREWQRSVIIYKKTGKCPNGKPPLKRVKNSKSKKRKPCNRNLPNCKI